MISAKIAHMLHIISGSFDPLTFGSSPPGPMLHEISSSMVKYILLLAVTIKTDNNLKLSGSNLSNKKKLCPKKHNYTRSWIKFCFSS